MARTVLHYAVRWNAFDKTGRVGLHLQGVNQPVELPVGSAAELAAIGVVLAQSPVFYDDDDGSIRSEWEQPAD